jgi:putative inorganic carbon (HCO3(-)) transporter
VRTIIKSCGTNTGWGCFINQIKKLYGAKVSCLYWYFAKYFANLYAELKSSLTMDISRERNYKIIFWLLFLFIILYPFFTNPFAAPVFVLPKVFLLRFFGFIFLAFLLQDFFLTSEIKKPFSPAVIPLFWLTIIFSLATIFSIHTFTSLFGQYSRWEGWLTFVSYLALFIAAYKVAKDSTKLVLLSWAIIISAAIIGLISVIEYFWANPFLVIAKAFCAGGYGSPSLINMYRSLASLGSPLNLAAYLSLTLPFSVAIFLFQNHSRKESLFLLVSIIWQTLGLLLSYGRAAWLGTGVSFLILLLYALKNALKNKTLRNKVFVFLVVILLTTLFIQVLGQNIQFSIVKRVASFFKLSEFSATRLEMWRSSLYLVADRPLFGFGPETFKLAFAKYKPAAWVTRFSDPPLDRAHNDILQRTSVTGILGLLAYLWFLVALLKGGFSRIAILKKNGERGESLPLVTGFTVALVAYLVQIQFNFSHPTTAPFFWLMAGFLGRLSVSKQTTRIVAKVSERAVALSLSTLLIIVIIFITLSGSFWYADIKFARAQSFRVTDSTRTLKNLLLAVRYNPLEPHYWLTLGETYIKLAISQNNLAYLQLAEEAFNRAQSLNKIDEKVYFRAGSAYLLAGRNGFRKYLSLSIKMHRLGLLINPRMSDAYLDLGVAYAYLNRSRAAELVWREAIKINPNSSQAFFNLGWLYEKEKDFEKAKQAYWQAYQLDPKMKKAKQALERF